MFRNLFLSHNLVLGIINTPKFHPFIQHFSFPFVPSTFCTTTSKSESESESDAHSFAVSYLINNFGFSTQSALKAFNQKQVRFKSPDKPNSVINFFKNHDFSDSKIRIIIRKSPRLLSAEPHKNLLPKFQCFLSKGVSSSDIVSMLTANPEILKFSLEKRIIPRFESLSRFLKTDKDAIVCLIRQWYSFDPISYDHAVANINLMTDFGVCDSAIATLVQTRSSIFGSTDFIKTLEEIKGLGFRPSTTTFGIALTAKGLGVKLWDEKVNAFKKWDWSDEDVLKAFRQKPQCMLVSVDKINLVMSFWVNQLGWDAMAIAKTPHILC
ncbi:unnamed protein product [Trifolium pratense]|uniref:Uncharacterized protein n=1 Tax=Trifolium pratense TaxID=57577 RepID=A0ACB0L078_TRIPR|nr:unnamed protein product [Trifolium pratense]